MHEHNMRPPTDVWMYCHREDKFVVLTIEVIEVVHPNLFYVSRINPSVAVRALLHEHHWRQVVDIPTAWYLYKTRFFPLGKRLHPFCRLLGVVDLCPLIARAQPIAAVVFVRHGVVVFDAIAEQELGTLFRSLPPGCDGTSRRLAIAESSELLVGLVENIALLLKGHVGGVLVRVAV